MELPDIYSRFHVFWGRLLQDGQRYERQGVIGRVFLPERVGEEGGDFICPAWRARPRRLS